MSLLEEAERRAALAARIATLEERSIQGQKQLDRIETSLQTHSKEEEGMLKDINHALVTFKASIEEQITTSINPIKADVEKYKTTVGVVFTILSVVGGLLITFHEYIIKFFTGHS
jgi:hypothetical protein